MKKRRINTLFFFTGVGCLIAFVWIVMYTLEGRTVLLTGELVYVPIARVSGWRNQGIDIEITGEIHHASGYNNKKESIGDVVGVRYIKGKYRAMREYISPTRYTVVRVILASILLIVGIPLIIESFKGKSMWQYKYVDVKGTIRKFF